MLHDNNLIEMFLRLNRSEPLFRTIVELPGIGRRPRTRDDLRLRRNLPLSFMVVRQKPDQTFIFSTFWKISTKKLRFFVARSPLKISIDWRQRRL